MLLEIFIESLFVLLALLVSALLVLLEELIVLLVLLALVVLLVLVALVVLVVTVVVDSSGSSNFSKNEFFSSAIGGLFLPTLSVAIRVGLRTGFRTGCVGVLLDLGFVWVISFLFGDPFSETIL